MANPEHLAILEQGVDVWNKWREENPDIRPDLSGADISKRNLEKINFSRSTLIDLNLNSTILSEASLADSEIQNVNLVKANLYQAKFWKASILETNFSGAYLGFSDFLGARLIQVDMSHTNLHNASFYESKLGEVNFSRSDLSTADFCNASCRGVDFVLCNLENTNFEFTTLTRVDFSDSKLGFTKFLHILSAETNFTNAELTLTYFIDFNLSKAKGLETCNHCESSVLDYETLLRSKNLPLEFLRGCGVNEDIINLIPVWQNQPIQFYSSFISHSSKDKDFVERLYSDLQNKGIRCWYAPEDLKIGDKIRDRIDQAIRIHDKLMLVFSEDSINSKWVEDEVESALEKERKENRTVLFPIMLDDSIMETDKAWAATVRRSRHIGDFTNWKDHDSYQKAFDRLLRDLKME